MHLSNAKTLNTELDLTIFCNLFVDFNPNISGLLEQGVKIIFEDVIVRLL